MDRLINIGADITIIGGALFKKVATTAQSAKSHTSTQDAAMARRISSKSVAWRKKRLAESVSDVDTLTPPQWQELLNFLEYHHAALHWRDVREERQS